MTSVSEHLPGASIGRSNSIHFLEIPFRQSHCKPKSYILDFITIAIKKMSKKQSKYVQVALIILLIILLIFGVKFFKKMSLTSDAKSPPSTCGCLVNVAYPGGSASIIGNFYPGTPNVNPLKLVGQTLTLVTDCSEEICGGECFVYTAAPPAGPNNKALVEFTVLGSGTCVSR